MAIQQRRGAKADFDATKMLPGELAVTTDGSRKVYVAFAPGDAKELASTEDVEETIQSGIGEIEQKKEEALAQFPNYEDKLAELEIYKANSIISTSSGTVFHETDCAAVPPINIKLFGKSTQDGTPSIETPIEVVSHGESGSINNCLYTNQLIDISALKNPSNWIKGTYYYQELKLPMGTYTISFTENNMSKNNQVAIDNQVAMYIGTEKGTYTGNKLVGSFASSSTITNYTFTINEGEEWYINLYADGKAPSENILSIVFDELIPNIMINVGNVALPCEHFTEQPFTVLTPNGLRGIPLGQTIPDAIKNSPIHMSGVYWDTVEQRYYIGDTKNEDGKDVQRIGKDRLLASRLRILDSYCNEESNFFYISLSTNYLLQTNVDDYICDITKANLQQGVRDTENHGYLNMSSDGLFYIRLRKDSGISTLEEFKEYLTNNEVFIYIILKEPIITETDTQLDVVMNYPNTTIVNDEGAYMEVEYVADTQKHIEQNYVSKEAYNEHENRIAELEKAIVNS